MLVHILALLNCISEDEDVRVLWGGCARYLDGRMFNLTKYAYTILVTTSRLICVLTMFHPRLPVVTSAYGIVTSVKFVETCKSPLESCEYRCAPGSGMHISEFDFHLSCVQPIFVRHEHVYVRQ